MSAKLLLLISCFVGALSLNSCVHFPHEPLPALPEATKEEPKQPVWVVSGELHGDFVVQTSWLVQNGCRLPESVKSYRYLCFGWGDRVAYTQRWKAKDITKALFWPTESIVQVVAFDSEVEPSFPQLTIAKTSVPASRGAQLANFLNQSFRYDEGTGEPITLRPAKWGHGYFIASPYSYYLPRMCNQWVATALQTAGVNTSRPTVTMSSRTLIRDIEEYNQNENP